MKYPPQKIEDAPSKPSSCSSCRSSHKENSECHAEKEAWFSASRAGWKVRLTAALYGPMPSPVDGPELSKEREALLRSILVWACGMVLVSVLVALLGWTQLATPKLPLLCFATMVLMLLGLPLVVPSWWFLDFPNERLMCAHRRE